MYLFGTLVWAFVGCISIVVRSVYANAFAFMAIPEVLLFSTSHVEIGAFEMPPRMASVAEDAAKFSAFGASWARPSWAWIAFDVSSPQEEPLICTGQFSRSASQKPVVVEDDCTVLLVGWFLGLM